MEPKGERRQATFTDHDREFLTSLVDAQSSVIKTDLRWIKLLASFALTVVGGVLVISVPTLRGVHASLDSITMRMSTLELESKSIQDYHKVIMAHKNDHMKCHTAMGKDVL